MSGGVDRIAGGTEVPADLAHAFDYREQVRQDANEPVNPDHNEHVAEAEPIEQACEFRPGMAGARGFLLENLRAACGAQLARLRLQVPGPGGDLASPSTAT